MPAGTWKRRFVVLALLAALAAAYLGASALLEAYAGHTCDDPSHCIVCQAHMGYSRLKVSSPSSNMM